MNNRERSISDADLGGISVAAEYELFVAVINHPHLRLVLALVKKIAQQGGIWRNLCGFRHVECVRQLQLIYLSRGWNNVSSTEGRDLRVVWSQNLNRRFQSYTRHDFLVSQRATQLDAVHTVARLHCHVAVHHVNTVKIYGVVDEYFAQIRPIFRDCYFQYQSTLRSKEKNIKLLSRQMLYLIIKKTT